MTVPVGVWFLAAQVGHRFFAVVDRSVIGVNPRPAPQFRSGKDPAVLFVRVID